VPELGKLLAFTASLPD